MFPSRSLDGLEYVHWPLTRQASSEATFEPGRMVRSFSLNGPLFLSAHSRVKRAGKLGSWKKKGKTKSNLFNLIREAGAVN